jgi:hypothetical protein
MAVPTSYLTTARNLAKILASIQNAQAPKQFTTRFLASLGFPSAADRLIIGVLKSIGFLTAEGAPTKRYFEYLDQTQAKRVMAEGIRDAYADLFQINRKAHELSNNEIKNKLKTLTQGQVSDAVLDKMALTLKSLAQHADFAASPSIEKETPKPDAPAPETPPEALTGTGVSLGGLVYNIQIILPSDRDQAVYDALFRSLKEHLLK